MTDEIHRRKPPLRDPAATVIRKCGGVENVAKHLGLHPITVMRWAWPSGYNEGRDGIIPARHQIALLKFAKERRISLRPADFFSRTEAAA